MTNKYGEVSKEIFILLACELSVTLLYCAAVFAKTDLLAENLFISAIIILYINRKRNMLQRLEGV